MEMADSLRRMESLSISSAVRTPVSSSGGLDAAVSRSAGVSASRQRRAQDAMTMHVLAAGYDVPRVKELRRHGVPEHLYFYSLVSSPMKDDRTYAADCEDGAEGGEEDGDVDMDESNRWSF